MMTRNADVYVSLAVKMNYRLCSFVHWDINDVRIVFLNKYFRLENRIFKKFDLLSGLPIYL